MLAKMKQLFKSKPKTDYATLVKEGALIVDVRSPAEFAGGHIRNAINIPLDQLGNKLSKLKDKEQCIICCCASGMRSGSARNILQAKGYRNVYNGGGWTGLRNKI